MSLRRSATFIILSLTTFLVHLLFTTLLHDCDGNPTMAAVVAFFATVMLYLPSFVLIMMDEALIYAEMGVGLFHTLSIFLSTVLFVVTLLKDQSNDKFDHAFRGVRSCLFFGIAFAVRMGRGTGAWKIELMAAKEYLQLSLTSD